MLNTPVLLLIFNRPEETAKVFDAIRQVQPKYFYIAADGVRKDKEGEVENCSQARKILEKIDWDCEVQTLLRDENLGCKLAVSSAINWFFENVEQGIILEDDCLPHPSFFAFCEELLEYYKDDTRVMHITGNNPLIEYGKESYYFIKLAHVWGWATWRRAWKYFDVNLDDLDTFISGNKIADIWPDNERQNQWMSILKDLRDGKIDTWDYQWMYAVFCQNGLCINSSKNLISNIGFGENATHTKEMNSPRANRPVFEMQEIVHPLLMYPDRIALDKITGHYKGK